MKPPAWLGDRLQLNDPGVKRVLGPLEHEIMTVLWRQGPVTVRDITDQLAASRSVNTIGSTLKRLVKKGLAERLAGFPSQFVATLDEDALACGIRATIVRALVVDLRTLGVPHFLNDLQQQDPDTAALLTALLNRDEKA